MEIDLKPFYRSRKQGGITLTYVGWADLCHCVNASGVRWEWSLRVGDGYLVGVLTVWDGGTPLVREAVAPIVDAGTGYSNPLEEAESAAFRRAWAKFGVGLELWRK